MKPTPPNLFSRRTLLLVCLVALAGRIFLFGQHFLAEALPVEKPALVKTQTSTPSSKTSTPSGALKKVEKASTEGKQDPKKSTPSASKKGPSQPKTPSSVKASIQDFSGVTPETRKALNELNTLLQEQHRIVQNEMRDEEEESAKDIAMLWEAALERSGTIRYAIEKLSRRDATGQAVTDESLTKKLLKNMARVGGVAGTLWTGTPAGLMGGQLVQELISGDPTQMPITRVTDADMVILAKEVERLQTQVIEAYYRYKHSFSQWQIAHDASQKLVIYRDHLDQTYTATGGQVATSGILTPETLKTALDALYQNWELREKETQQTLASSRNELALLVGLEALVALEKSTQTTSQEPSQAATAETTPVKTQTHLP